MIKVVAFDFDDTLFDTRKHYRLAFVRIADYLHKQHRLPYQSILKKLNISLSQKGLHYKKLFNDVLAPYSLGTDIISKLVKILYTTNPTGLKLYADGEYILDRLKQKSYRLVLITNGESKRQIKKIRAFDLHKRMNMIIYCRDLGYEKPNPKIYEYILKKLKIKPKELLVVGDDPFLDLPGANALGIKTVRILRGEYAKFKSKGFDADMKIKSFYELEKNINKLNR